MNTKINFIISSLILFLFVQMTYAGTVTQVKNNKVLLDVKNESVNVDDQFFIVSPENKKVAIVQVKIVKNGKAVADVLKGTAVINGTTLLRSKGAQTTGASSGPKTPSTFVRHDLIQIAFHLKYMLNTIATKQEDNTLPFANKETVTMTGGNIGLGATIDYPLYDWLKATGQISLDMLDIAGTAQFNSCNAKSSTDCNAKINYLTLGGLGKYEFNKTNFIYWAGLGAAFKIPISKKSSALLEENIQTAQAAIVAFGIDYHLDNKTYLPFSFEYYKSFNTSDSVPTIDQINLTVGYGLKF